MATKVNTALSIAQTQNDSTPGDNAASIDFVKKQISNSRDVGFTSNIDEIPENLVNDGLLLLVVEE